MGKAESTCDCCGEKCINFWQITCSREYLHLEPFGDYKTRFPYVCWSCQCRAIKKITEENKR